MILSYFRIKLNIPFLLSFFSERITKKIKINTLTHKSLVFLLNAKAIWLSRAMRGVLVL